MQFSVFIIRAMPLLLLDHLQGIKLTDRSKVRQSEGCDGFSFVVVDVAVSHL